MIQETEYFSEFLDFGYLWMRDVKKDERAKHRPLAENEKTWDELRAWQQFNQETQQNRTIGPHTFFERCPMHWLGNLLSRPSRLARQRKVPLVLAVSLEPGRPPAVEIRETNNQLFYTFGKAGSDLIRDCSRYYEIMHPDAFWRKISRISFRALKGRDIQVNEYTDWLVSSLVHIDLWPLRSPKHSYFMEYENVFPDRFKLGYRHKILSEFIEAANPDLTILVGRPVTLGLQNHDQIPFLNGGPNERVVRRSLLLERCFQVPHTNSRGMGNEDWNSIGTRIGLAL